MWTRRPRVLHAIEHVTQTLITLMQRELEDKLARIQQLEAARGRTLEKPERQTPG